MQALSRSVLTATKVCPHHFSRHASSAVLRPVYITASGRARPRLVKGHPLVNNPSDDLNNSHSVFMLSGIKICSRGFAKKAKEGKKDLSKKGKIEKPSVELSPEELNEVISFDKLKQQMEMTVDHLRKEYAEQLTLRTSISLFDNLSVDTPDGKFPLIQIGQIVQKNPNLLMINMAATPHYIANVKTAIMSSGMNINPQQDGTTVFLPIPKVTREHREMLAKNAKVLCEKTKEKLRNIQNNFARDLKKVKDEHSEDLIFNLQETIHATFKIYNDLAESCMKAKQQELLGGNN